MKLSTKLTCTFALTMSITLGIGPLSLGEMASLNERTNDLSKNWLPSITTITQLNNITSNFRRRELAHILSTTNEVMQKYETQMNALIPEIDQTIQNYTKLITHPKNGKTTPNFLRPGKATLQFMEK